MKPRPLSSIFCPQQSSLSLPRLILDQYPTGQAVCVPISFIHCQKKKIKFNNTSEAKYFPEPRYFSHKLHLAASTASSGGGKTKEKIPTFSTRRCFSDCLEISLFCCILRCHSRPSFHRDHKSNLVG